MAGTKAGARLRAKTMIEKYGSSEAYLEHQRAIASKGGTKSKRPKAKKRSLLQRVFG